MQGIHLIRHAVYRTAELGGQFLLLGSGHADGDFRAMAATDFKDSRDVRIMVNFLLVPTAASSNPARMGSHVLEVHVQTYFMLTGSASASGCHCLGAGWSSKLT